MKDSFLFLAEGFEEIEAITCIDILRRAGIDVKTVSISGSHEVKGAHGISIVSDMLFNDIAFDNPEWIILPGGMPGATNLYEFKPLCNMLERQMKSPRGKIAAICAAPAVVLGQLGLLKGERATCYPGFEQFLAGSIISDAPVTVSDRFVLGNGPANAMKWALAIVHSATNENTSSKIGSDLLFYPDHTENIDFNFG